MRPPPRCPQGRFARPSGSLRHAISSPSSSAPTTWCPTRARRSRRACAPSLKTYRRGSPQAGRWPSSSASTRAPHTVPLTREAIGARAIIRASYLSSPLINHWSARSRNEKDTVARIADVCGEEWGPSLHVIMDMDANVDNKSLARASTAPTPRASTVPTPRAPGPQHPAPQREPRVRIAACPRGHPAPPLPWQRLSRTCALVSSAALL